MSGLGRFGAGILMGDRLVANAGRPARQDLIGAAIAGVDCATVGGAFTGVVIDSIVAGTRPAFLSIRPSTRCPELLRVLRRADKRLTIFVLESSVARRSKGL